MRKSFLLVVLALVVAPSSPAATYVVPVVTAQVKNRVYTTTLALRNDGDHDVACEAIYAVSNDPKGGTLRATYTVPRGGRPHVEEDVLMEVGAVGTMRDGLHGHGRDCGAHPILNGWRADVRRRTYVRCAR
ncbi:MAG: hypothetical protein ACYC7A_21935 [Thermoanaerobaculia bacterium]